MALVAEAPMYPLPVLSERDRLDLLIANFGDPNDDRVEREASYLNEHVDDPQAVLAGAALIGQMIVTAEATFKYVAALGPHGR